MNLGNLKSNPKYNIKNTRKKFRSFLVSERFLLSIIKILASDMPVMRRKLINIKRFLEVIDKEYYSTDPRVTAMILACDSLLVSKMRNNGQKTLCAEDLIHNINNVLDSEDYNDVKESMIIPQINIAKTDSIEVELSYVTDSIDQNLKWSFVLDTKDDLYELSNELSTCSFKDFPEVLDNYRNLITSIMNFFRSTDASDTLTTIMHTTDPSFYDFLYDTFESIRNPSSALKTGWNALNSALGPRNGFQNKNLYIFHANTNSFKSALLLHIARMIKMYNADSVIEEFKKTGKIPTILFIEAENDFDEDNERLYKITVGEDIVKCTSREQLIGNWTKHFEKPTQNNDKNPIDISMVHVDARSVSVDDIDKTIEILDEEGYKVITCIVDYIGIMKCRQEDVGKELRTQLANIANDLLSLAKNRNIPVITAHQLNRSGGAILTNLKMQGGSNAVSQMTNEYIGESYGIEQAASWTMFIDIEMHDGQKFLTCKRNKSRYQSKFGIEYFVYRIRDGIIIDDDIFNSQSSHLTAIPNTEVTSTTGIGNRGTIDIRDGGKRPQTPKNNVIDIAPKEIKPISQPIPLIDSIPFERWFEYAPIYGLDKVVTFSEEFTDENSHFGMIGETEYIFMN